VCFACSAELSEQILRRGHIRHYPIRSTILRQGDRATTSWLIVLGRAHALLYGAEGQMVLLHEFGPGDLFGALGDLAPTPDGADVVAVEEVRSFLLEAAVLVSLAERHGSIGLALSRMLLKRLRETSARVYARAALSAPGRVCAELLRLAREGEGGAIRPAPVIAEIALRVGTTRETASRTVNALERRGLIRRDAAALILVAPARIEAELV
jgi:CRP-like cAMP-binding protein